MSEHEYLVKRCIPLLLVNQLKACIRSFNEITGSHLRISGNKGELIQRIQQFVEEKHYQGNSEDYDLVKQIVLTHFGRALPIFERSGSVVNSTPTKAIPPQRSGEKPILNSRISYSNSNDRILPFNPNTKKNPAELGFIFKPSPFYDIVEMVSEIKVCHVQEKASLVCLDFQLKKHHISQLQQQSSNFGLMLFGCAYDESIEETSNSPSLVEFPQMCEVKVNTTVLQASLRGLKNKPGTVNPPDITDLCNLDVFSTNKIDFMYANTSKKYVLMVEMVKKHSVDSLINTIKESRRMSKDEVLQRIKRENEDTDIIATSSVVSLKCPLSYQRIKLPCRSTLCPHIQCFDGLTFFRMNEQTPTWTCPTCNRSLESWDTIVIDGYFEDILQKVPEDIESIIVEPNGDWSIQENKSKNTVDSDTNSLDSLSNSSEPTTTGSKKRKVEVIDLTLESDSEGEEETHKRLKRSESVSTSTAPLSRRFPNLSEIAISNQITPNLESRSSMIYPNRSEIETYRINPIENSISEDRGIFSGRHENRDNLNESIRGITSMAISSPIPDSGLGYMYNTHAPNLQLTAPFVPPNSNMPPVQPRSEQLSSEGFVDSRSLSPIAHPPTSVALRRTPADQMQIERLSPLAYGDSNYEHNIYNSHRYGTSNALPQVADYRGVPSYMPDISRYQHPKYYSQMMPPENARSSPHYPDRSRENSILKIPEEQFPSQYSRSGHHRQLPDQYHFSRPESMEMNQDPEEHHTREYASYSH
ncbi:E3 SUMO-protein ligase pli1 [Basidiobolus ranarum]|uniref:E3 SUMO-protein ligase pli1 n=1 Tax=Basidiobolus ranarum TaxID=34480 RepID=A0ABR2X432_9FUNG